MPLRLGPNRDIINRKGAEKMRDFPLFTTDYGISSLTLREIPYRQLAYICIRDVQPEGFEEHLKECVSFCVMAGAEHVYASGHNLLEHYPLYTAVLEMQREASPDREKMASIFPVTEATAGRWRQLYNERMKNVDNARTLEARDEKQLTDSSGAYFVHENGELLGIGWLDGDRILAVASVRHGAGERVMHTLISAVDAETVKLEVASTNRQAMRLYERMGFVSVREISRWYCVHPAQK